jgi:hypothetical protein
MQRHITIVAGLYIALSVLLLVVAALLVAVVSGVAPLLDVEIVAGAAVIVAWLVALFWAVIAIAGIVIGVSLHKRRSWARTATIVLSIVNLLNFPIGTAVGVYALWVMLNPETETLFSRV